MPRDAWLNEPWDMHGAEHNKLDQLVVARKLGFEVPRTIVSNDWGTVDDTLAHEEAVVFKPFQSIMYDPKGAKLMFTRSSPSVKDMPHDALPYPGIFQNFAGKAREWRITVVGDETFDAAVYTHEDAKNDWRERQTDASKVTWRKEKLDDDVREKCIAYLGHYGLRFGTFDSCEDADGKVVFLEMNPNGQYGWLEHDLGLPISRAIANELLSIAQKNS